MNLLYSPSRPWWVNGLIFGAFMLVVMTAFNYFVFGDPITKERIFIGIGTWTVVGLAYGYAMKNSQTRKMKED